MTFSQAAFSLPAGVAAGSTRSTWVPYAGSSVPAWPPVGYGWGQWGGLAGGFPPQSVWWPPPLGPGPVPLLPYVQGVAGGSSSLQSGPSAVPSVPPASSTSLPSVAPVSTSAPVPVAGPSGLGSRRLSKVATSRRAPALCHDGSPSSSSDEDSDVFRDVNVYEGEGYAGRDDSPKESPVSRRPSSDRSKLREAVKVLGEVRPEAFAPPGDNKSRCGLSAVELVLGSEPEQRGVPPLFESPLGFSGSLFSVRGLCWQVGHDRS